MSSTSRCSACWWMKFGASPKVGEEFSSINSPSPLGKVSNKNLPFYQTSITLPNLLTNHLYTIAPQATGHIPENTHKQTTGFLHPKPSNHHQIPPKTLQPPPPPPPLPKSQTALPPSSKVDQTIHALGNLTIVPSLKIGRPSGTDQQIMDQSHEVSLDINEIATSLREHLKTNKAFSQACCIYRVPARLRRLNEEAYTPSVVSIGPIHHGKENLKAMEDHKIMYLQQFLEQSKVSVEDLITIVRENETELRDCYAETIDLSRKDFATMILLDAVFVIMVLLKLNYVAESNESLRGDQIFFRPWKFDGVVFDMCLLENQLPFFFLEKLFELYPTNCTIMELTFELLKEIWANWVKEDSREKINSSRILHFVDFLRKCQQPAEQHLPAKKTSFSRVPTTMELHQSGVKFKNPKRNSLFDIRFSSGILEIPRLTIDDSTEILFRNVQAFEQCHHRFENMFVSNYITFISCLVRAPTDVEVLVRDENLKNLLNSDEAVSNLLYNLQQENYFNTN
uniref:Uncharacterized protein n=1 Tax=Salix viminalis TaxID=40686 RepID=A0A6N2MD34_SALVM